MAFCSFDDSAALFDSTPVENMFITEVISLIADNHADSDIIHGLNQSIAGKTAAMAARAGGCAPYMMTGGVARNLGVVRELEKKLGAPLFIAENPDLCGALGAALFALGEG